MKKIFALGAIALFTLGSSNVKAQSKIIDCFTYADTKATKIGADLGLSDEDEHDVFIAIYDGCMNAQN